MQVTDNYLLSLLTYRIILEIPIVFLRLRTCSVCTPAGETQQEKMDALIYLGLL